MELKINILNSKKPDSEKQAAPFHVGGGKTHESKRKTVEDMERDMRGWCLRDNYTGDYLI